MLELYIVLIIFKKLIYINLNYVIIKFIYTDSYIYKCYKFGILMSIFKEDIKKRVLSVDWFLVFVVLLASVYGMILISSATNPFHTNRYIYMQIFSVGAGAILMLILSFLDYDHWIKYAKFLYAVAVFLLVMTLIFGTGEEETGNKNWIRIPGTPIGGQPSELVKILFILTFSRHLDLIKEKINKPKNVLMLFLHAAVIIGLIVLEKDIGTALVFLFICICMCFSAGLSLWYFIGAAFLAVVSSPLLWRFLSAKQQQRIIVGFNPNLDPSDVGYQVLQSKFAIGSGGLLGAGYKQGYMTQNGLVPRQWTDFIFSAAGEEFGFIGLVILMLLLSVIFVRIYIISRKARNDAGTYICIGIFAMFIIQTVENIGMCLGLLPVIGITLPFFSYGGSSVLSSWIAIGVVLSVNSRRKIYYFTRDEKLNDIDYYVHDKTR